MADELLRNTEPPELTQISEPNDPGTVPSGIGDPVGGGLPDLVEEFQFPEGGEGRESGPLGERPALRLPTAAPFPPIPPTVGSITTRTFPTSSFADTYERLEVSVPTVFLPISTTAPDGSSGLFCDYYPTSRPPELGLDAGFPTQRGAFYCWAPGIWWAQFIFGAGGDTITYAEIPVMDRTMADLLLDPRTNQTSQTIAQISDQAIAAATVTTVFEASDALVSNRIDIANVGANPMRLTWYNANPAANFGLSIAAGEAVALEGSNFPVSRARVFSTAGTTVSQQRYGRFGAVT